MFKKYLAVLISLVLASCGSQLQSNPSASTSLQLQIAGQNYYIDCSAPNNGNGTFASPWNNFVAVNATTIMPGGGIFLKRGVDCNDKGTLKPIGSGTATQRNYLGAYPAATSPNDRARIDSGNANALYFFNVSYWEISDLKLSSSTLGIHDDAATKNIACVQCYTGLYIDATTTHRYFRINNLEATGNWTGLVIGQYRAIDPARRYLTKPNQGRLVDVEVTNVYTHDNEGKGLFVGGNYEAISTTTTPIFPRNDNIRVLYTAADNNGEDGIFLSSANNSKVEYSSASYNGAKMDARYGIWFFNSDNVAMRYNESHHNKTRAAIPNVVLEGTSDGGGLDCDFHVINCVIEYNYTHDNEGPGILLIGYDNDGTLKESLEGCTVRYNISQNDVTDDKNNYGAITLFGNVNNCKIYNNTVFFSNVANTNSYAISALTFDVLATATSPRYYWGIGSNNTVRNNLFYIANGARGMNIRSSHIGRGNTYDYDLFYSNQDAGYARLHWGDDYAINWFGDVTGLCAAFAQECNGRQGNPFLSSVNTGSNGYQISNLNSPAIGLGLNTSLVPAPNLDFYNNPIAPGAARDIGAHQSNFIAPQIVTNQGAETSLLTPWIQLGGTNSGATNIAQNIKTGMWSFFTGTTSSIAQNFGAVTAERTYKLSAWVKAFAAFGTAQGYIGIQSTAGSSWDCNMAFSATSFTQISKTCYVPTGVTAARVYIWANTNSTVWVDDVSIQ